MGMQDKQHDVDVATMREAFSDGVKWACEMLKREALAAFWGGNDSTATACRDRAGILERHRMECVNKYPDHEGTMASLAHDLEMPF